MKNTVQHLLHATRRAHAVEAVVKIRERLDICLELRLLRLCSIVFPAKYPVTKMCSTLGDEIIAFVEKQIGSQSLVQNLPKDYLRARFTPIASIHLVTRNMNRSALGE